MPTRREQPAWENGRGEKEENATENVKDVVPGDSGRHRDFARTSARKIPPAGRVSLRAPLAIHARRYARKTADTKNRYEKPTCYRLSVSHRRPWVFLERDLSFATSSPSSSSSAIARASKEKGKKRKIDKREDGNYRESARFHRCIIGVIRGERNGTVLRFCGALDRDTLRDDFHGCSAFTVLRRARSRYATTSVPKRDILSLSAPVEG